MIDRTLNPRQQDITKRLKEFANWLVSTNCGNVPEEATMADEAAREIEDLAREVNIWREKASAAEEKITSLEQVGVVIEAGDHIDVSINEDVLWAVGEKLYRFKDMTTHPTIHPR